jgi:hypothetical protein
MIETNEKHRTACHLYYDHQEAINTEGAHMTVSESSSMEGE